MTKFKVGDKVRCINPDYINSITKDRIYEVLDVDCDGDISIYVDDGDKEIRFAHRFELANESKKPAKPDDMVRYMAYGTGCDNKSKLVTTEKELKEDLKKCSKDSGWTGRIIGYKMTPIYEAEEVTRFKVFKIAKIKKVSKKK